MIRTRLGDDRGSVVAEFAVVLPAIVLVLLVALGMLFAGGRQVRLQDAAADAARLAARGESDELVRSAITAAVPGATSSIGARGDLVCVTAAAPGILGFELSVASCALAGGL